MYFFNVLKFEEYIVHVKVWIWIWWKCWIINLSLNSLKSLLNFVNFLKFYNFLNIENFIIRIKKNKKTSWLARRPALMWGGLDFSAHVENAGQDGLTRIVWTKSGLGL